jgi:TorA maturation chaperone TorD
VSDTAPLQFVPTLAGEEQARANFYGLLARLFYRPPDGGLLEALAAAGDIDAEDETLAAAWRALCEAAAAADAEALREEFDSAFVGTGRAPITLYTSAYSIRYSNEAPLAELRGELAALGLARRVEVAEPEDHIAALCDTMRHLIAGEARPLEEQRRFFLRWIYPIVEPLCAAIEKSEHTAFYKTVARFAKGFFSLEHSAFEML